MSVPSYWREIPARYRLEAGKCTGCDKIHFPKRPICSECRGNDHEDIQLSRKGTVVSFSEIHAAPPKFAEQVPYVIGIIELDRGVRISCQIADCHGSDIRVGAAVQIEFRRISQEGEAGIINYGYKAVLL